MARKKCLNQQDRVFMIGWKGKGKGGEEVGGREGERKDMGAKEKEGKERGERGLVIERKRGEGKGRGDETLAKGLLIYSKTIAYWRAEFQMKRQQHPFSHLRSPRIFFAYPVV